MENEGLRNCPFCDGEADIKEDENGFGVTCLSCGAEIGYNLGETEYEAVNTWNKRVKTEV